MMLNATAELNPLFRPIRTLAVGLLALWLAGLLPSVVRSRDVPDILFVSFDTLRRDHVSCYGHERLTTPTVDALASQGVLFSDCQAVVPLTGPSHVSMFTGVYPQSHGAWRNGVKMREDRITLPKLLGGVGYQTHAVLAGWTLKDNMCGLGPSFDSYDDEGMKKRVRMVTLTRIADSVTDGALKWADSTLVGKEDRPPYFLFVHYFDPHEPFTAPIPDVPGPNPVADGGADLEVHQSKLKDYDKEIAFTDAEFDRLLQGLRARGLLEDTLIVFTADHGQSFGEHGYGDAEGAHGRKAYQATLAAPLVISATSPERVALGPGGKGRVSDLPVSHLDLFPTLAELAKVEAKDWPSDVVGTSLAEVLQDASAPAPWGKAERRRYGVAFPGATGNKWNIFRIFQNKDDARPTQISLIRGKSAKFLTDSSKKGSLECYDLGNDPGETQSRCPKSPSTTSSDLWAWFEATKGKTGKTDMSDADREALKGLGYTE